MTMLIINLHYTKPTLSVRSNSNVLPDRLGHLQSIKGRPSLYFYLFSSSRPVFFSVERRQITTHPPTVLPPKAFKALPKETSPDPLLESRPFKELQRTLTIIFDSIRNPSRRRSLLSRRRSLLSRRRFHLSRKRSFLSRNGSPK